MKGRNAFLAFVMAAFSPGLGYLYVGRIKYALVAMFAVLGIYVAFGLAGQLSRFWGAAIAVALISTIYIASIIHSVIIAFKSRDYQPAKFNRWYVYIIVVLVYGMTLNIFASNRGSVLGYEMYRIVSGSMIPVLTPGDRILVDTDYSKYQIGDLVAFRYPENPNTIFLFRIAAMGNQSISISDGEVVVDGIVQKELSVDKQYRTREHSREMATILVPEKSFFVLGDNRDNSRDSRFWGFVPHSNIVGRVTEFFLSEDFEKIGMSVQ